MENTETAVIRQAKMFHFGYIVVYHLQPSFLSKLYNLTVWVSVFKYYVYPDKVTFLAVGKLEISIECHTRWDVSWIDKRLGDSQARLSYMDLVSANKDCLSPNDETSNRVVKNTFKVKCIEFFHLFLTESWTLIHRRFCVYMATTVGQM